MIKDLCISISFSSAEVNTPDIRQMWNQIAIKSANQQPSGASLTPVTTMSSDGFSTVASSIGYDEDLQMNMALRNSLKTQDNLQKSTFTPDGKHINTLRTSRHLFQEADKRNLDSKVAVYSSSKKLKHSSFSSPIDVDDSPLAPPSGLRMSTKVSNRIYNNGLDPAYFASTQIESPEDHQSKIKNKSDVEFDQKIRYEVIRHMQHVDGNKAQARTLYRILTRGEPKEQFMDVDSIASDCNNQGMSVSETVELMLAMI